MTNWSVVLASVAALALFGHAVGPGITAQPEGLIAYHVFHSMPDGLETSHVCLADVRTGRTQRLTHERFVVDVFPAWSPDGSRLAFTRSFYLEGQTANIFAVDRSGSNLRLIARDGNNLAPDWSPDGTRIAYAHGYHGFELRVMSADGSGRRSLGPAGPVSHPRWSPDGTQIAFTKDDGIDQSVWVIGPDGRGQRKLIDNASQGDWSPDGSGLAFSRFLGDGEFHIWVARADGTNQKQLTATRASDGSPAWSPDGAEIAFARNGNLYGIRADGGAPRLLIGSRLREESPAWVGTSRRLTDPACSVLGGPKADRLLGTTKADYIYGGRGGDAIHAGRGRDVALGEAGADRIYGGHDSDALGGGPGDDRLDGGAGRDILYGGRGADLLVGGGGSDVFRCGPGRDRVILRGRERAARDCEIRIRVG
jgi:dipeptidyl aminopeptidase/acylaminoacyl peptidase